MKRQISAIDLEIKKAELASRKQELAKPVWSSPLVLAILAAALAGLSNAIVAVINGTQQVALEDRKSEQARILKMLETGDADKAATILKFLLEGGLIENANYKSKLESFLASRKPGQGPSLNVPVPAGGAKEVTSADMINDNGEAVGLIIVKHQSKDGKTREMKGTCFAVSRDGYLLTASRLIPEDQDQANLEVSVAFWASSGSDHFRL